MLPAAGRLVLGGAAPAAAARRPRSPARRCRARSARPPPCRAWRSARSGPTRSWRSRPPPARTCASSAWRSASDWRLVSCSPARRVRASFSRVVSARSFSPSVRMLVMTRTRSFELLGERHGLAASSGKAEASSMALRTMASASSRRVTITGGGLRPMRCMAASSAEIEPCRASSVPRSSSPAPRARRAAIRSGSAAPRSAGSAWPSPPAAR